MIDDFAPYFFIFDIFDRLSPFNAEVLDDPVHELFQPLCFHCAATPSAVTVIILYKFSASHTV